MAKQRAKQPRYRPSAKPTMKWADRRLERKMRKAEIQGVKLQNKAAYRKAKAEAKVAKIEAKNRMPIEKMKTEASVAKHATWAGAISNAIGKGTSTANKAMEAQNVNGGLSSTNTGRDTQDNPDEETYPGPGEIF